MADVAGMYWKGEGDQGVQQQAMQHSDFWRAGGGAGSELAVQYLKVAENKFTWVPLKA